MAPPPTWIRQIAGMMKARGIKPEWVREMGYEPATPTEARRIIGLRPLP